MKRRSLILAAIAAPMAAAGCSAAQVQTFPSIASALQALEALHGAPAKATGAWSLPNVLEHCAQSIEFSLKGFPQMKSALFRSTVGAAAFTAFSVRSAMSHALAEPIPGAATLTSSALEPPLQRLIAAFKAFEAHSGKLHPHFAYGELNKVQYASAHLMHLANHWTEVSPVTLLS
jgi:hypothetical protein